MKAELIPNYEAAHVKYEEGRAQIEAMAEAFGCDKDAMKSLMIFLLAYMTPENCKLMGINTEEQISAFMTAGVKEWHRRSEAFFNELLNNSEKRAEIANVLAEEIYNEVRAKHAN